MTRHFGIRRSILASAYLLDWIAGDPEWFPHPVRLIGLAIHHGERLLRRPEDSNARSFVLGGALTCSLVLLTYKLTRKALTGAYRHAPEMDSVAEVLLAWTCLASRSLQDEASSVLRALEANDLPKAREKLARIVGRDTQKLDEQGISRALIETLAESSCDGIFAPLFYLAVGGVPLAMAFKTISTLDSMIGHTSDQYFYFGKVAARLDDVANYLPARFSAMAIVAAAALARSASPASAAQVWLRDGNRHQSPNAGQPEAAMAGALQVRLGGPSTYDGELMHAPILGGEFEPPTASHAAQATRLTTAVSLLGFLGALVLARPKRQPVYS